MLLDLPYVFMKLIAHNVIIVIFMSSTDSDQVASKPSSDLLDFYKIDQLREIIERVYNANDMKRLSIKLSTAKWAHLSVIFINMKLVWHCIVNLYFMNYSHSMHIMSLLSPFTLFQCKIDKMIMFHAIAKFFDRCAGGTSLKKQLGVLYLSVPWNLRYAEKAYYDQLNTFASIYFFMWSFQHFMRPNFGTVKYWIFHLRTNLWMFAKCGKRDA